MDFAKFLSELPRRTISPFFGAVGNEFDPLQTPYLQSLGVIAGFGLVGFLLCAILLAICRCCRCCCAKSKDSDLTEQLNHAEAEGPKGASCCAVLLVMVLLVAAAAVAIVQVLGAVYVSTAGGESADAIEDIAPTLTTALAETASLTANAAVAIAGMTQYETLTCSTECGANAAACAAAATQFLAGLPSVTSGITAAETLLQTPADFIGPLPGNVREYSDIYLASAGVIVAAGIIVIISSAWRRLKPSRGSCVAGCCATVCSALACLVLFLLWVGAGVQLATAAAASDLCRDWTGGALRAVGTVGADPATDPYSWLLTCPATPPEAAAGPFSPDLTSAAAALTTAATAVDTLAAETYTTQACTDLFTAGPAAIGGAVTAMQADLTDLQTVLVGEAACTPIATAWDDLEDAWCGGNASGMSGLALGAVGMTGTGLVLALLFASVCCKAPAKRGEGDDDLVIDDDFDSYKYNYEDGSRNAGWGD